MSNSVQPCRQQPTRLPRSGDSPGKNTGVGCHFLLQCMKVKSQSEVAQSCRTLSNPMDCSLPGSSIHEIFQARVLEWVAIAFSLYVYRYTYISIKLCIYSIIYIYIYVYFSDSLIGYSKIWSIWNTVPYSRSLLVIHSYLFYTLVLLHLSGMLGTTDQIPHLDTPSSAEPGKLYLSGFPQTSLQVP